MFCRHPELDSGSHYCEMLKQVQHDPYSGFLNVSFFTGGSGALGGGAGAGAGSEALDLEALFFFGLMPGSLIERSWLGGGGGEPFFLGCSCAFIPSEIKSMVKRTSVLM